jgi:hypothetical protein
MAIEKVDQDIRNQRVQRLREVVAAGARLATERAHEAGRLTGASTISERLAVDRKGALDHLVDYLSSGTLQLAVTGTIGDEFEPEQLATNDHDQIVA